MTRRQIRKEAYRKIVKEGRGHQETFDELRKERETLSLDELAIEVSKIPSKSKIRENKIWIGVFTASLVLIVLLRSIGIFFTGSELEMNFPVILLMLVMGLIFPVLGIVFVATGRIDQLKIFAILFIISILRSLQHFKDFDEFTIIGLIPYAPAIILGFWLPERIKTLYTKKIDHIERDDQRVGITRVVFDQQAPVSGDDLIDSEV